MILGDVSFSVKPTGQPATDNSLFLAFKGRQVLLYEREGVPAIPTYAMVKPLLPQGLRPFELAHTETCELYVPDPLADADVPEGGGLSYHGVRAFHDMPFSEGAILTAASHLWSWYRRSRRCGACGQPTTHCGEERALQCPGCGEIYFPMIAPAVIVAITCGDSILLARNVQSELNHYALIAGYVEVGETLEHAVKREVLEEVGLAVSDLRYLGDQPWGISGTLMFAFHAQADKNAPLCLQASEIAEAKWVEREALTPVEHPVSIAYELMERFRTQRL